MRAWLARRYASYTPDGKFWLTIGALALIVDMAIGYCAGYAQATIWHGIGGAGLAAGFAFLPDAAYEEYERRRWISAGVIALFCIPIGVKAYEQQLTYSAGMRAGEMQAVGVQNTKYTGAQEAVGEDKTNLALWKKQLGTLIEQNAWAGTVKADGLRAELDSAQKAIDLEAGRGGCKSKCLILMQAKADLEKRIAIAEQASDLTQRIEATQRILDGKRTVAAKTEHKQSLNVDVARVTARLVKIASGQSPDEIIKDDETTQQLAMIGSAGLGSLALLLLAPIGFFLAGRRRAPDHTQPETHREDAATPSSSAASTSQSHISSAAAPLPVSHNMRVASVGDLNRAKLRRLLDSNSHQALAA